MKSPRVFRSLRYLRKWRHEKIKQVFPEVHEHAVCMVLEHWDKFGPRHFDELHPRIPVMIISLCKENGAEFTPIAILRWGSLIGAGSPANGPC